MKKGNGKRCLLLLPRRNDNHEFVTVYSFDVETIKPQKVTKKYFVDGHHHRHVKNLCDLYIQVIFHILLIIEDRIRNVPYCPSRILFIKVILND